MKKYIYSIDSWRKLFWLSKREKAFISMFSRSFSNGQICISEKRKGGNAPFDFCHDFSISDTSVLSPPQKNFFTSLFNGCFGLVWMRNRLTNYLASLTYITDVFTLFYHQTYFRPYSHETFLHTILQYCDKKIFDFSQ